MSNNVILVGRLTADPELRTTSGGKSVVDFRLAVQEGKDYVNFIDVVAWTKTAEFIAEHFTKGKPIDISGGLVSESWETEDGQKRSRLRVRADRAQFVPGGKKETAGATTVADKTDDIPF